MAAPLGLSSIDVGTGGGSVTFGERHAASTRAR